MTILRPWMCLVVLVLAFVGRPAAAHEVRPGYLDVREQAPGRYLIVWKQPVMGDWVLRLHPQLSSGWLARDPDTVEVGSTYLVSTWTVTEGDVVLAGQTLSIAGLDATVTDVLVSVSTQAGGAARFVLRPDSPRAVLRPDAHTGLTLPRYLELGITHILTGIDHLCFVFGLVLLVGFRHRLIGAISAFTIAHSITLACTALGIVKVDPPVIEMLVALSILFLAVEVVRTMQGRLGLTARKPWLIAFAFGLLHGFAFAGALAEVGLPRGEVVGALLLFNVGVELGQLAFIAGVFLLALAWRSLITHWPMTRAPKLRFAPGYLVGALAGMWFIDRAVAVMS